MAEPPRRPSPSDNEPAATRLESEDEIRRAVEAKLARLAGKPLVAQVPASMPAPPASPAPPAQASRVATPPVQPGKAPVTTLDDDDDSQPDRPSLRPPMAMLCILDDGKTDGEWIRIRADRTVLGRSDGDIRIPHDAMMSGQHAEIVRQKTPSGWRWLLMDLNSTNGSFVRVGSTLLRHGSEVLIGAGRYRFEAAVQGEQIAQGPQVALATTQAWQPAAMGALTAGLVEVSTSGNLQRIPLTLAEYWIGRAAHCGIARPGDLLCSPRHARLYRDNKGQWHIDNNRSLNGLWLRVDQLPLGQNCQIRLGEQRFLFRVVS